MIPIEGTAILASSPGYGKSWMLADLAIETARGERWLNDFPTTKGRVLYVDEENPSHELRRRFRRLLASKGLADDQLDIHLALRNLDAEHQLPVLSTYLGHTHVSDTYWYLSAVPELVGLAAPSLPI